MEEIFADIYRVLPSSPSDEKWISFFIRYPEGNLIVPGYICKSTIHAHFGTIERLGGVSKQLLSDAHYKTRHCDEVAERFNAPLYCSQAEADGVRRDLKHIVVIPYTRHFLLPGIEVIPTPGHRPGAICYRIALHNRQYLFTGDTIWHNGRDWVASPTKAGIRKMEESLRLLMEIEFDVLLANNRVDYPVSYIEVTRSTHRRLLEEILSGLE